MEKNKDNNKDKALVVRQKQELEEWERKINSGEAYKIARDFIE